MQSDFVDNKDREEALRNLRQRVMKAAYAGYDGAVLEKEGPEASALDSSAEPTIFQMNENGEMVNTEGQTAEQAFNAATQEGAWGEAMREAEAAAKPSETSDTVSEAIDGLCEFFQLFDPMSEGHISEVAFDSVIDDLLATTGRSSEEKESLKQSAAPHTAEGRVEYRAFAKQAIEEQRFGCLGIGE
jgi:hypothetical protein